MSAMRHPLVSFRSMILLSSAVASMCLSAGEGHAATYRVGPGRAYAKLQDVANLLNPGDIVEVDGNVTYPGDVTFTRPGTASNPIVIRGIVVSGRRPLISGGTNTVHFRTDVIGKGADHYVMEGFEVTGGSSRCVFHQSDDVTLRQIAVHDCPAHGILGADWGSGSLTVEHSEVYRCGSGDRLHQVYASADQDNYPNSVFRLRYSYLHDANGGNNVKSRAARNEIYYNRIEGAYYHELELIGSECCGEGVVREDGDIVGNLIIKTGANSGFYVTRFGGDGTAQSWGRYRFVNNTVIVAGTTAVFRLFDGLESVDIRNNVFYRSGGGVTLLRTVEAVWAAGEQITGSNNWVVTGSSGLPTQWAGTVTGTSPGFMNPGAGDYSPAPGSPLIDAGEEIPSSPSGPPFSNPLLSPAYHPAGAPGAFGTPNPRPADRRLDIGAWEVGMGATSSAGDFDGDGKADILWRRSDGALYLWLMNGTSLAGSGYLSSVPTSWRVEGIADLNGDRRADILWQEASGATYVWLMNGSSVIAQGYTSARAASSWAVEGLGDFDADGRADLLWRHTSGSLHLWLMDGSTVRSAASLGSVSPAWQVRGLGDFDGDGKADILWRHPASGSNHLWLMNGPSVLAQGGLPGAHPSWHVQGVADLNGDGRRDILWRHTGGALYQWQMSGLAVTASAPLGTVSPTWQVKSVGDFGGDSKADLLWRELGSGTTYEWLMSGFSVTGQGFTMAQADAKWQVQ